MAMVLFRDGSSGLFEIHHYWGACLRDQSTCYVVLNGKLIWVKPGESVSWVEA